MTSETAASAGPDRRRRRFARRSVILSALLFVSVAASAQAHTGNASATCRAVTLNWTAFATTGTQNAGTNTPNWSIVFAPTTGTPVTLDGAVSFTGSSFSLVVPIPAGNGTAMASSSWSSAQTRDGNASSFTTALTIANCPATTTISTTASPGVALGGAIHDSAVLTGGSSPTGTITFTLHAAADATCASPLTSVTTPVTGNGTYTSPSVTPTVAGSYQWVARYGGDTDNTAAVAACNVGLEQVAIAKLDPTISTTASPGATLGGQITDTAVLAGGSSPTGTITFSLYATTDATCTTALSTVTATVSGAASYTSPPVTPANAGSYQWVATYGGDADNASAAGACNDPRERLTIASVPVLTAPPTPASVAAPGVTSTAPSTVAPTPTGVSAVADEKAVCATRPATLSGVARVAQTSLTARVTSVGVRSVTFYLDGRKLATQTRPKHKRFSVTISARRLTYGAHRVEAKVTMTDPACAHTALSGTFIHPKAAAAQPTFTG